MLINLRMGLGPSQRTETIHVDPNQTVNSVIASLNVPGNVSLMFEGQKMDPYNTLAWYELKEEDTLHLMRAELVFDEPTCERPHALAASGCVDCGVVCVTALLVRRVVAAATPGGSPRAIPTCTENSHRCKRNSARI